MFWQSVCSSQQHWCKLKPFIFLLPTQQSEESHLLTVFREGTMGYSLLSLLLHAILAFYSLSSSLSSFPPSPHLSPSSLSLPHLTPLLTTVLLFFENMFCFPLILLFPGSHAVTQSLPTNEHWGCTPPEKHEPTRGGLLAAQHVS